jgi:hypothetical protein
MSRSGFDEDKRDVTKESGNIIAMSFQTMPPLWVTSALAVVCGVSVFGAIVEKWQVLGEVNPDWPKDLPTLWREWNLEQLLEQHRSMYPNSTRIAWFRFFHGISVAALIGTLLLAAFLIRT